MTETFFLIPVNLELILKGSIYPGDMKKKQPTEFVGQSTPVKKKMLTISMSASIVSRYFSLPSSFNMLGKIL